MHIKQVKTNNNLRYNLKHLKSNHFFDIKLKVNWFIVFI
jgi:hypothetical protein